MKFATERLVGIQAVIKASRLCQNVFNNLVKNQTITKTDSSPVTVADFGAQAVVNHILNKHFPNDKIVGEEDAKDLRENKALLENVTSLANSVLDAPLTDTQVYKTNKIMESIDLGTFTGGNGRFWTLDPIDGTKGFLRGEQYAVCLALIEDGIVKVAIQGCPNLPRNIHDPLSKRGSLFIAVRGEGAFERCIDEESETRIHVSDVQSPQDTAFCESVEAAHSSQTDSQKIAELLGITKSPIRMDSQCKYAVLARGDAGIYLRLPTRKDYQEKIWDHAGGSLLIEESGGTITDIYGNKLDFAQGRTLSKNKGIIATNGKIHDEVLNAVRTTLRLKGVVE